MSSSKRLKLSLKKPRKNEKPSGNTQTIISMFKKHNEKEENIKKSTNTDLSSSSEGDVVITKVENKTIDSSTTSSEYFDKSESHPTRKRKLSLKKSKSVIVSTKHGSTSVVHKEDSAQQSPGRYMLRKKSTASMKEMDSDQDTDIQEEISSKKVKKKQSEEDGCEKITSGSQKENAMVIDLVSSPSKCSPKKRKHRSEENLVKEEKHDTKSSLSEPVLKHYKLTLSMGSVVEREKNSSDKSTAKESENMARKSSHKELLSRKKLKSLKKSASTMNKNLIDLSLKSTSSLQSGAESVSEKKMWSEGSVEDLQNAELQEVAVSTTTPEMFNLFRKGEKGNEQQKSEEMVSQCTKASNEEETVAEAAAEDEVKVSGNLTEGPAEGKNEEAEYRVPYYLENFRTILDTVFSDAENARLFDKADMHFVNVFNNLEEDEQKLYIRIFSRKLSWLPLSKLTYVYSKSLEELVDTLTEKRLLLSGDSLTDLDTMLGVMSAPDLQSLAKSFHLNVSGVSKPSLVEQLKKKSQQNSIGNMFGGGARLSIERSMIERARNYLGKLCRLAEEPRAVFIRVLMLFSLYNTNFDEDGAGGGGQGQLFQMLMANIGRVVYPQYKVHRERQVFKDREAVIRFEMALQLELDLQTQTEKNRWSEANTVYRAAREQGRQLLKQKAFLNWDKGLPLFLRAYTAGSVYTRIDSQGVEILQRLKKYKEAVDLLRELLSQEVYCDHYRGHWYERLALNLDAHLKSPAKSLDVIKEGLNDAKVTAGRRLALYQRAEKICGAPKSKFADRLADFVHEEVIPAPEHFVEGMVLPDASTMKVKYQFIMSGDTDAVTLCAVEELALDHYANNGFPEGLHWEGALISHLFTLLCWDLLFMDVPDVFQGPFQTHPLDKDTPDFYLNRQEAVDSRLALICKAEEEELCEEISAVWGKHEGTLVAGINWERFSGPAKIQGLVRCMGGKIISALLERYVRNPRHTRSGFPDLTLWNTDTKTFKISEVKGPGDRLSHKQILWLDFLLKLGVEAEVCYVKAVGSKKLKKMESS